MVNRFVQPAEYTPESMFVPLPLDWMAENIRRKDQETENVLSSIYSAVPEIEGQGLQKVKAFGPNANEQIILGQQDAYNKGEAYFDAYRQYKPKAVNDLLNTYYESPDNPALIMRKIKQYQETNNQWKSTLEKVKTDYKTYTDWVKEISTKPIEEQWQYNPQYEAMQTWLKKGEPGTLANAAPLKNYAVTDEVLKHVKDIKDSLISQHGIAIDKNTGFYNWGKKTGVMESTIMQNVLGQIANNPLIAGTWKEQFKYAAATNPNLYNYTKEIPKYKIKDGQYVLDDKGQPIVEGTEEIKGLEAYLYKQQEDLLRTALSYAREIPDIQYRKFDADAGRYYKALYDQMQPGLEPRPTTAGAGKNISNYKSNFSFGKDGKITKINQKVYKAPKDKFEEFAMHAMLGLSGAISYYAKDMPIDESKTVNGIRQVAKKTNMTEEEVVDYFDAYGRLITNRSAQSYVLPQEIGLRASNDFLGQISPLVWEQDDYGRWNKLSLEAAKAVQKTNPDMVTTDMVLMNEINASTDAPANAFAFNGAGGKVYAYTSGAVGAELFRIPTVLHSAGMQGGMIGNDIDKKIFIVNKAESTVEAWDENKFTPQHYMSLMNIYGSDIEILRYNKELSVIKDKNKLLDIKPTYNTLWYNPQTMKLEDMKSVTGLETIRTPEEYMKQIAKESPEFMQREFLGPYSKLPPNPTKKYSKSSGSLNTWNPAINYVLDQIKD